MVAETKQKHFSCGAYEKKIHACFAQLVDNLKQNTKLMIMYQNKLKRNTKKIRNEHLFIHCYSNASVKDK